jgi:hypothetical protein
MAQFMVFDAPLISGVFEDRVAHVRAALGVDGTALGAHVKLVDQVRVTCVRV